MPGFHQTVTSRQWLGIIGDKRRRELVGATTVDAAARYFRHYTPENNVTNLSWIMAGDFKVLTVDDNPPARTEPRHFYGMSDINRREMFKRQEK